MGAGKSTLGPELAARLGREFVSVDALVEARTGMSVSDLFVNEGEAAFRQLEQDAAADVLGRRIPVVVELGGGALGATRTTAALREGAFTVLVETTVDEAWERVVGSDRPLASDRATFEVLFEERKPLYEQAADARAHDVAGAVLAAAGVHVESGTLQRLADLVPGDESLALVMDTAVESLHGDAMRSSLGQRLASVHTVPAGESAKTLAEAERLWAELRLDRLGTLVAVGGGSTLDVAGFVAATYLRGIPWIAVPSTLVGAGRCRDRREDGDRRAGGQESRRCVSLAGSGRSSTRARSRRCLPIELENGRAEVVKTGLLDGPSRCGSSDVPDQVRECAAFKAAICLRDPFDRGERAQLNLGHTFAHALEVGVRLRAPARTCGRAWACSRRMRLSGLEHEARLVEDVLHPKLARVDREAAWAALGRDKKSVGGAPRLVLLEAPGRPRWGVEVRADDVRSALDSVIE